MAYEDTEGYVYPEENEYYFPSGTSYDDGYYPSVTSGEDLSGGDSSYSGSTQYNPDGSVTYTDPDGQVYTVNQDGTYATSSGGQSYTYSPSLGGFVDAAGKLITGGINSLPVAGAKNDITKFLNGLLGTSLTDKQIAALGIGGGALAGLLGATTGRSNPVGYQGQVPTLTATRQQLPAPAPRAYGAPAMGRRYFTDTTYAAPQAAAPQPDAATAPVAPAQPVEAAQGGLMAAKGRYLRGETDGMADKIRTSIDGKQPAALSHGEFIIPADVVSHLGNGNSDAGAKKLKNMMSKIRKARTGTTQQGKQINPDKFMPGGLAYAAGGAVKRFATGAEVSGTALNSGLAGTESNLSNWAGPYVTNMLGQGQALANAPYQAYTGQLTAGVSPLQQTAFDQASALQVPGAIGSAATTAGNIANTAQSLSYTPGTTSFGTEQAQQYMNPYLRSALDPQMAELQRQNQIANMNVNAKLTAAGGFGGGRQAVANAENQRNMLQQMNQTLGQGYSNAFQQAQAQFNADQARKMAENQFGANYGLRGLETGLQAASTQGQLGAAQNQAGLANIGALSNLGATQRGIESEALGAEKAQFEEERANPYKMVQYQQSLLQGLPLAAQNYNVAQPSVLQQLAGGSSGVATLLKSLGYTLPGQ